MRMPGVPDGRGSILVRLAYWVSRRNWGQVLEPLRIYAHVPRIMMGFGKLLRSVEKSRRLPAGLKSLAMARTAMQVGCPF